MIFFLTFQIPELQCGFTFIECMSTFSWAETRCFEAIKVMQCYSEPRT